MLNKLASGVLELLWPAHCAACDLPSPNALLCAGCAATTVPGTGACCPRCGLVWLDEVLVGREAAPTCGDCLKSPPPWVAARAAFAYGGAMKDVIARWKNAPDETLGPHLGGLMVQAAPLAGWSALPPETLVVPMPGHPRRIRERGFNPAGVLAFELARGLELELAPLGLRARRLIERAHDATRALRQRRVAGAFEGSAKRVAGREVLLVDDVITTGATARVAVRALRRAGASRVHVAALARVGR